MTSQPLDMNNNPLPALRLKNDGAHTISASATSARNATAFHPATKIVSLFADVPVYVRMGDSTVAASASDHYFPDGIYYDFAISAHAAASYTHIAVIRASGDNGSVYISEKE